MVLSRIANKNVPLKPNEASDLKRIVMDENAERYSIQLLYCSDHLGQRKSKKVYEYFLVAKADIIPLPNKNAEFNENAPSDFA